MHTERLQATAHQLAHTRPAGGEGASAAAGGQWSCAVCTLRNEPHAAQCSVCGEKRPTAAASADAAARFAHIEMPHQTTHRYSRDDNARIAAARGAFLAGKLPRDRVRLPESKLCRRRCLPDAGRVSTD